MAGENTRITTSPTHHTLLPRLTIIIFMLLITISSALAATNITTCQTINTSGEYTLQNSITSNNTGNACLDITANNVDIDFNGYYVDGDQVSAVRIYRAVEESANISLHDALYLSANGAYTTAYSLHIENAADVNVHDLTIAGQYGASASQQGLNAINADNLILSNVNMTYGGGNDFHLLKDSDNVLVEGGYHSGKGGVNTWGVYFDNINGTVTGVTYPLVSSTYAGVIRLDSGSGTLLITNNTMPYASGYGEMYVYQTVGTVIYTRNYIHTNRDLYLFDGGTYYDNFINGSVFAQSSNVHMNTTKGAANETGVRIIGDGPLGGNYWGNISDTCADTNFDGFCDDPVNASATFDFLPYSSGWISCIPDWVCDGYAACAINDTESCNSVTDNNACGDSYTGDYSEFAEQSCDYCTPSWECTNYTACAAEIIECTAVNDTNACYAATGLPSDDYSGDMSEFDQSCAVTASEQYDETLSILTWLVGFVFLVFIAALMLDEYMPDKEAAKKIRTYLMTIGIVMAIITILAYLIALM